MSDAIDPDHYKLGDLQPVDIAEHLSFSLGNVVKYVARAGRKGDALEDLRKARWYLDREIGRIKQNEKQKKADTSKEMNQRANFITFRGAEIGTMRQAPDGTNWMKTQENTWKTIGPGLRVGFTDDFGLAERFAVD